MSARERTHSPPIPLEDFNSTSDDINSIDITEDGPNPQGGTLHRTLKARHVSMIAIGGTIGTGLFLGSGFALAMGGPLGALIGFGVMSMVTFSVTTALGEMCAFLPVPGGFTNYATRFVDPALGFTTGWNYWYGTAMIVPLEVTAATVVISYWLPNLNLFFWTTLLLLMFWAINFIGTSAYGEIEFWLSIIKVIALVCLLMTGIILVFGGGPTHDLVGFRYWNDPGVLAPHITDGSFGKFLGVWACFIQAGFSFIGTELVAVAAAEAENPARNIPKAVKRVFIRIGIFYMLGILLIGLLIPYNDPLLVAAVGGEKGVAGCPFVIFLDRAEIKGMPSIINAVIFTAVFSAGNSFMYSSSRVLHALALEGKAPAFLKPCNSRGLPLRALLGSILISLMSYMNLFDIGSSVLQWFVKVTAVGGLGSWVVVCISYVRFYQCLKAKNISRDTLPYKSPFQPYSAYISGVVLTIIVLFNGWDTFYPFEGATFVASYSGVILFVVLYFGYKYVMKTKVVPLVDIDLSMAKEYKTDDVMVYVHRSWWEKLLDALF